MGTANKICHVYLPGKMEYKTALLLQQRLAQLRHQNKIPDSLLLLEHPPTYTITRKSCKNQFNVPTRWIEEGLVSVETVDRGGGTTYHGPGQLIGYPILHLGDEKKEIVRYLRKLEEMLVASLRTLGLPKDLFESQGSGKTPTGVWLKDGKVASIGIKVDAHMITSHGFALNVSTDLHYFDVIVPCGIRDRRMVSLKRYGKSGLSMNRVIKAVMKAFGGIFAYELVKQEI